ncbi:MAG: lamin tail domain-containing protein, partial [Verrucomicrobiales bacterium]
IFYNPDGQEEASEYIELMNASSVTISLAGVSFTGGISHEFADDVTLEPGERLLLVSDITAFEAAFGTGLPVAGTYGGQLDNGGESLTLTAADDHEILSLRYNDRAPWPLRPDNDGTSLTLVAPGTNPDANDPENWRSSLLPGGTPGTSDALPFNGATTEELLAYILPNPLAGISPSIDAIEVNGSSELYLVASASQYLAADDAVIEVQFSADLKSWQSDSAVFLGSFTQAGNTTRKSWRALLPLSDNEPLRYARLVVSPRD